MKKMKKIISCFNQENEKVINTFFLNTIKKFLKLDTSKKTRRFPILTQEGMQEKDYRSMIIVIVTRRFGTPSDSCIVGG